MEKENFNKTLTTNLLSVTFGVVNILHPKLCVLTLHAVLCHLVCGFYKNSLVSNGRLFFLLHCIYCLFAFIQIFYSFTEDVSLNIPYVLLMSHLRFVLILVPVSFVLISRH